jgi:hypothetical protein
MTTPICAIFNLLKQQPQRLFALQELQIEDTGPHSVFSGVCVRGDVVIASAPPNEVAQITSGALPEIPTAAHFTNSLVFLSFTDGGNDDCTYGC